MMKFSPILALGVFSCVGPANGVPAADQAAQPDLAVVYLVRHAEKGKGVDDPHLTERGRGRAHALSVRLSEVELSRVYATPYRRTRQTVEPTARAHGLDVTQYEPDGELWAEILRQAPVTVLVAGHSNTVPRLIGAFGIDPAPDIGHDDYGDLFIVTVREEGASLRTERYGGLSLPAMGSVEPRRRGGPRRTH